MNKQSIIEVAIWKSIDNPDLNKELILNKTNLGLSKLDGYINRTTYQSTENENLMVDICEWNNSENAHKAANEMMNIDELREFVGLISETVLFEHFSISNYNEKIKGDSNIIEIVHYKLKNKTDENIFFNTYSQVVKAIEGYRNRYILKSEQSSNEWLEIVFWDSANEAKNASSKMIQNESIQNVFNMVEEVKIVHSYFKKFN